MGSCLKKVAEKSPAKWVWFVAENHLYIGGYVLIIFLGFMHI